MHDPYHAFLPYPPAPVAHAADGPLSGLTLAVKDIYHVAGYRTGAGCPTWLAESPVHEMTAPCVQALLDAGARFVGKVHTDELAWSMYGMNAHFGTPVNPAAPDRIPGGSSSGSAVAVAGGLADIAIGSDTGGSVRAPASFCGTWGWRPTHGLIPMEGAMALAPSFDACGVFARDGAVLARAAAVLVADSAPLTAPDLMVPTDMLALLGRDARAVWQAGFGHLSARPVSVYPDGVEAAYATFLTAVMADAKETILPFIRRSRMPLVRGIDARADAAEALTPDQITAGRAAREGFARHMDALLGANGVLLAPVVHDAPFRLDAPVAVFDSFRHDAQRLLCVAGMARLPQVVFPAGTVDGAPFGLSLIGPRGSDLSLIALACQLARQPQEAA
ncbi:amidase [Paracoccus hibiscisoli]|uniref:Amidase n=1 Tax=Paracoccus hibiscisoli TaxID=2023261 RepID=A0A4U0QL88_9RHOB|nr:amidase [Paracoccus hibiscisoli]TJZ82537.1 amidase [Paracoccus hibiscisoli]